MKWFPNNKNYKTAPRNAIKFHEIKIDLKEFKAIDYKIFRTSIHFRWMKKSMNTSLSAIQINWRQYMSCAKNTSTVDAIYLKNIKTSIKTTQLWFENLINIRLN